jgi:hypothetical protein
MTHRRLHSFTANLAHHVGLDGRMGVLTSGR